MTILDAHSWAGRPSDHGRTHLVIEATTPGDTALMISVYRDGDGPSVVLDATQLREIAADLTARADLIERDHASNDPAGTIRREEHLGDGGESFAEYRKEADHSPYAPPWRCIRSSSAYVIGQMYADAFVDEFPRVTQPAEETPPT